MNNNWDESKHPRDVDGKFTSKGNTDNKALTKEERYHRFIENWELLSERYRQIDNLQYTAFTQIYSDEVEQFFGDELMRWGNEISLAQIQALHGYTARTSGAINKFLRTNGAGFDYVSKQYLRRQIALISSALADFKLERNILVYRVEDKEFNAGDIGDTFVLKGFTSTSVNRRHLAINYGDCVQYQIEVPAGKGRGAYIRGVSGYKAEYEFLLQRNTKVQIIRQLDDGEFKIVRLRVLD